MSTKDQHIETNDTLDETLEGTAQPSEAEAAELEGAEPEVFEDTRLADLAKQAEENQQRYLRAQADFDNFRRRTAKEKEDLAQYASMKLIDQLVPIVDNFERALAAASVNSDFDSLAKGVDMIFRQLSQTLEAEGLKPIEAVGQPFNPEFHQAIMQVESDQYEEGYVVEEVQKGYMLKEKVLRPAMVKVSG
ncbi:nucleotide exchange factor GrpE [Paenibacillus sp. strain BS8-2]